MFKQSINEAPGSAPISINEETLHIHELGYELGASAAEQWLSVMHFKKYKGLSYLMYRNAAAKSCLKILRQPAFNDEFEMGFKIGFEQYAHHARM